MAMRRTARGRGQAARGVVLAVALLGWLASVVAAPVTSTAQAAPLLAATTPAPGATTAPTSPPAATTAPTSTLPPTATPTQPPTATPTTPPTPTPLPTATDTPTALPTATVVPPTSTPTSTPPAASPPAGTLAPTDTPTPTSTAVGSGQTPTATPTGPTASPTGTLVPGTATAPATAAPTARPTDTPTSGPTPTATLPPTPTETPTPLPTSTPTATDTATPTETPTETPTATPSPTATPVVALTVSASPTALPAMPGATVSFQVSVSNGGSQDETVALDASDPTNAFAYSFASAPSTPIPVGGSATTALDVAVPASATPGSVVVTIAASVPSTAGTPTSFTTTVTVDVQPTVAFSRVVNGARVSQQTVPPAGIVQMTIGVTSTGPLANAVLSEPVPNGWAVLFAGNGTVAKDASGASTITWDIPAIAAGTPVTWSYQVLTPLLQSPPAVYSFDASLTWNGGSAQEASPGAAPAGQQASPTATPSRLRASAQAASTSTPSGSQITVADPANDPTYIGLLSTATAQVGQRTFHVADAATPTAATPADLSSQVTGSSTPVPARLADGTGIAIFASDPAPDGTQWNLGVGGPWTASAYLHAGSPCSDASPCTLTNGVTTVYRIDRLGNATPLFSAPMSTPAPVGTGTPTPPPPTVGTTSNMVAWSFDVPTGVSIAPGERFGVEIGANLSQSAQLSLDFGSTGAPSYVAGPYTTSAAPATLKETHARIGQDTPLGSMQWYAGADLPAAGLAPGKSFRVRFQVYNDGASSVTWSPRLDWAAVGASPTWAAVPGSAGSAPFFVTSTSQYGAGTTISALAFAPVPGLSAQNGAAYTSNPGGSTTLAAGSYTEIEFNLQPVAGVTASTAYALRLTDGGSPLTWTLSDGRVSVQAAQSATSPHQSQLFAPTTDTCAGCHRPHTAQGPQLQSFSNGKAECMTCHDGTGAAKSLSSEVSAPSSHPVGAFTPTQQQVGEGQSAGWNPVATRHVECAECHEPHRSGTGASTPGFGNPATNILGMWGVKPTNPTANWGDVSGASLTRVSPVAGEYQLCLACHSPYGYGSTAPNSPSGGFAETNQAQEFNPNNASYHSVEPDQQAGSGFTPRTADPARAMTFVGGSNMLPTTVMNCTDCHASATPSDPRGAHGSANQFILRGSWSPGNEGLCFTCHDQTTYGASSDQTPGKTGFSGELPNLHSDHMSIASVQANGCQSCHSAIPHGSQYPALLAPRSINGSPVSADPSNQHSSLGINRWAPTGAWSKTDCTGCHS